MRLRRWKLLCRQLWHHAMTAVVFDRHTLFHCFNGSNRSCAALRAWLIVAWNYSAGATIELLLVQRKAQRLWKLEGYMLDAHRRHGTQAVAPELRGCRSRGWSGSGLS